MATLKQGIDYLNHHPLLDEYGIVFLNPRSQDYQLLCSGKVRIGGWKTINKTFEDLGVTIVARVHCQTAHAQIIVNGELFDEFQRNEKTAQDPFPCSAQAVNASPAIRSRPANSMSEPSQSTNSMMEQIQSLCSMPAFVVPEMPRPSIITEPQVPAREDPLSPVRLRQQYPSDDYPTGALIIALEEWKAQGYKMDIGCSTTPRFFDLGFEKHMSHLTYEGYSMRGISFLLDASMPEKQNAILTPPEGWKVAEPFSFDRKQIYALDQDVVVFCNGKIYVRKSG